MPINSHIARQNRARKVLNFGRWSSRAAHTLAGFAETVSSADAVRAKWPALAAAEVITKRLTSGFSAARSYLERAVSRRCDQHRARSRSGWRGPLVPREPYVILR